MQSSQVDFKWNAVFIFEIKKINHFDNYTCLNFLSTIRFDLTNLKNKL